MMLYHVGCGQPMFTEEDLARASRTGGIGFACRCGANAPLVVRDLNDREPDVVALPASLAVSAVEGHPPLPHLEYYLGFSDFDCPAKRAVDQHLSGWRLHLVLGV